MRSKSQGLLATLMMFIPLLAVPFVASFGVPWLAAKAKHEGLPVPDLNPPSLLGGVGQSNTARHTAEDLFAPVIKKAVVDLRVIPGNTPAAPQPHLRNASLVVTNPDGWVDPFSRLSATTPGEAISADPPASFPEADASPLGDWTLQESPTSEAPAPQDFGLGDVTAESTPLGQNPFAGLIEVPSAPLAVKDDAFADPGFEPPANGNPDPFSHSQTLLFEEPLAEPKTPAQTEAPAQPPVSVGANAGTRLAERTSKLTWDEARQRLLVLGVQNYYLQPDAAGEVFHFRCSYSPPENPRVNRLFVAEDVDPLEAVRKGLQQVENWAAQSALTAN